MLSGEIALRNNHYYYYLCHSKACVLGKVCATYALGIYFYAAELLACMDVASLAKGVCAVGRLVCLDTVLHLCCLCVLGDRLLIEEEKKGSHVFNSVTSPAAERGWIHLFLVAIALIFSNKSHPMQRDVWSAVNCNSSVLVCRCNVGV